MKCVRICLYIIHIRLQVCDCTVSYTNCRNKSLTAVPPIKNGTFSQDTLDIKDNNIISLQDIQLPEQLKDLGLSNNKLWNSVYQQRNTLERLYVLSNYLTHIPDLSHMNNLRQVWLTTHNQIIDSENGPLPTFLQVLGLDDNGLTEIPLAISGLNNLTEIHL